MDIIGKIHPSSNRGHHFILAATDYFSKWSEAVLLIEAKANTVINFVKNNIIFRFGVPKCLYHDNGLQFSYENFYRFYDKYGIHCSPSTAYNPAANGLVEAFNKTIRKILKKLVSNNKKSCSMNLSGLIKPQLKAQRNQPHFLSSTGCKASKSPATFTQCDSCRKGHR